MLIISLTLHYSWQKQTLKMVDTHMHTDNTHKTSLLDGELALIVSDVCLQALFTSRENKKEMSMGETTRGVAKWWWTKTNQVREGRVRRDRCDVEMDKMKDK